MFCIENESSFGICLHGLICSSHGSGFVVYLPAHTYITAVHSSLLLCLTWVLLCLLYDCVEGFAFAHCMLSCDSL